MIFLHLNQIAISGLILTTETSISLNEYIGREVSKGGITMSSKKRKGVTEFPMPKKRFT